MTSSLTASALSALTCRVFAAAIAVAYFGLAAGVLGAEEAGAYLAAHTVAQLGGLLGRLGCEQVLVRMVASDPGGAARGVEHHWPAFLRITQGGACLSSLLVGAAGAALLYLGWVEETISWCLILLAPSIVPASYVQMRGELFKSVGRASSAQWLQSAAVPSLALGAMGLAMLSPPTEPVARSAAGLASIYSGSAFVAAFALALGLRVQGPRGQTPRTKRHSILREGRPLLVVSGARYVMPWIPLWTLGAMGEGGLAGVYAIAIRVALVLDLAVVAVNAVAAPRFAAAIHEGAQMRIGTTVRAAQMTLVGVMGPLAGVMILAPSQLLAVLGPEYAEAAAVLPYLAIAQLLHLWFGPCGALLSMARRGNELQRCVVGGALLSLLASLVLIPMFSLQGAVWAAAMAIVGLSSLVAWRARFVLEAAG